MILFFAFTLGRPWVPQGDILSTNCAAAEIALPEIDPAYTIRVDADTYAVAKRGSYDILAFEGNCRLRQGQLLVNADEITLWIERSDLLGAKYPGKVICYANGNAKLDWGNGNQLADQQWTGRLFSLHPVAIDRGKEITRYDIPSLDWDREPQVRFAQFTDDNAQPMAAPPPLLNGPETAELLPAPPQDNGRLQSTPGGVAWDPNARTGNTSTTPFIPQGGLNLTPEGTLSPPAAVSNPSAAPSVTTQLEDLSQPKPAAIATETLAPAFPSEPQVVRQVPVQPSAQAPLGVKSVQFFPRGPNQQINFSPYDPNRGESVLQVRGGFRLVVQGLQTRGVDGSTTDYGTVSLEADSAVIWVRSDRPINPLEGFSSTAEQPVELYLEGNIVFNQGPRVIYAERMYYNVSSEYGMVLSAEILTPVPEFKGLVRLKADVLQQLDARNFKAYGAAVTSSRMGVPRYWLQSAEVDFQDNRTDNNLTLFSETDPTAPSNLQIRSRSNHAYIGGVPVFYWPTFSTDLKKSSFYLSSLRFKNDTIFGFQTYAEWDAYQLLGIQGLEGTEWRFSTDYLSDRGPAIGTRFEYNRPTIVFGAPGTGFTDAWFIKDDGLDILGTDRINLTPEEEIRGRAFSRHRIFLSSNWELLAETGWISDRDFLEQYFENEWEQEKDYVTDLRLRRYNGNRLFEVYGSPRINDFFTETEWLPRINHYILGQDLFGQRFTYHAHSSVGYAHQRTATTPVDPQNAAKFTLLPWETDSEGLRAATRQELALPFQMGAFKLVPFLSGEAAFWNEDVLQDDVVRLTGQAGIRTALPMWSLNPNVENRLLDLRGLAHKVTWETEFFYADSSEDLDRFPLYDPLDDNSQEHFRRRFIFNTFGGALPPEFDERGHAFRTGMQRWVTAGSTEIVDDLTQLRFGINQRWQTKRGLPGRERVVDLVTFDTDFIFFPNADRDNFGEDVGVMRYDFRYHVGDRLTLLSDGYFDVFSQGLKAVSAGAQMSRPGRGDAYLGILSLEGPISANILNGFLNYRMNEKWILTTGAAFDFGDTGSIGQNIGLTRIGESALVRFGVNVDHGRDNVSFNFNFEPRFLQSGLLGAVGGELVPPAGLFGVE